MHDLSLHGLVIKVSGRSRSNAFCLDIFVSVSPSYCLCQPRALPVLLVTATSISSGPAACAHSTSTVDLQNFTEENPCLEGSLGSFFHCAAMGVFWGGVVWLPSAAVRFNPRQLPSQPHRGAPGKQLGGEKSYQGSSKDACCGCETGRQVNILSC